MNLEALSDFVRIRVCQAAHFPALSLPDRAVHMNNRIIPYSATLNLIIHSNAAKKSQKTKLKIVCSLKQRKVGGMESV
jgi:hypothetical protein